MLSKILSTFLIIFVTTMFLVMSISMVGLIGQWFRINSFAAHLADSQARYGGYTREHAQQAANQFMTGIQNSSLEIGDITASHPGGSAMHGEIVWIEIEAEYNIEMGVLSFVVPLSARGQSVSSFRPGLMSVTYVNPSP